MIDNVTVSPSEIDVELLVNVTLFTYVLLRIFSIVSFSPSTASVIFVSDVIVVKAPSPKVESSGTPKLVFVPRIVPLLDNVDIVLSTKFFVATSDELEGSAT